MSIVTITLNNKNFQLYCNDGGEKELFNLAAKLNDKIIEIKLVNPTASFELLLVMAALGIQSEIQNLTEKFDKMDIKNVRGDEEKFAETLTTIASYLENLAQKMGK
ncbi:cell division protein ZapA [Rickettsia endosymbiont of Polydrusus tereticollis]|uniref:cell division protein ZapA n=1 Tax=Rickettsia endosymbiont of Polydrusus tereticollis TaxID=3066251 RepID=UPI003132A468|nr:cell division protein ZapA [Rickettsia endosymbiont of Oxypoda opaca]